jgi:hypothetical protein
MSSEPDPAELEQQHQRDADKLQEQSKNLEQEVEDVGQDWKQKRADEGIPGAPMTESSASEDVEDAEDRDEDEDQDEDESASDEDEEQDESDEDEDDSEQDDEGDGD